jgi:hypothetical protein
MTESLRQVQRDEEADGWVQVGRGAQPWSFRYRHAGHGVI